MTDEIPPAKKAGFRSATRRKAPETRFRRLIGLCGLSNPEAAEFLGLAEQSAAQKAMGRRKATDAEIEALLELWAMITNTGRRLPESYPAGARRQQHALADAELFRTFKGMDVFSRLHELDDRYYPVLPEKSPTTD